MLEAPSTPLNPSPFLGGTHRPDFSSVEVFKQPLLEPLETRYEWEFLQGLSSLAGCDILE